VLFHLDYANNLDYNRLCICTICYKLLVERRKTPLLVHIANVALSTLAVSNFIKGNYVYILTKSKSFEVTINYYCCFQGMEYLEYMGIVHRDLAARNVLGKTVLNLPSPTTM